VITTAADAVAKLSDASTHGASLLPSMDDPRTVSAAVAVAVATTTAREGYARVELTDPIQQGQDAMWRTEYPHMDSMSGNPARHHPSSKNPNTCYTTSTSRARFDLARADDATPKE